jgi:hypothetical protein
MDEVNKQKGKKNEIRRVLVILMIACQPITSQFATELNYSMGTL